MNFKKFFASTTSLMLGVTAVFNVAMINSVNANAGMLNDPEYIAAANYAIDNDLTNATSVSGTNPEGTVTREQGAAILARFVDNVMTDKIPSELNPNCTFSDMDDADFSLVEDIKTACQYNILKGGNGMFNPKGEMTRAMLEVAIARMLSGMRSETGTPRFQAYRDYLLSEGVITKIVNGDSLVNRYALFLMIFRLSGESVDNTTDGDDLAVICEDETLAALFADLCADFVPGDDITDEEPVTTDEEVIKSGTLNVSLSSESPSKAEVPGGSTNVYVMAFDVTAGNEDIDLTSVTITAAGLTDPQAIDNVYIKNEWGFVLTPKRGFNSDRDANLTIKGGLTLKAGSTVTMYVYVDFKAPATSVWGRLQLAINSISGIESDALTVNGSFPISSATHDIINYTAQKVTITDLNATAAIAPNSQVTVGDMQTEVFRFTADISSENSRNAIFQTLTLENTDNISELMDNFTLMAGGTEIETKFTVEGDILVVSFDWFMVEDSESENFYLYADIIGGENNDKVQFSLDEATDLIVTEEGTNATLRVVGTSLFGTDYSLEEGDNLITKTNKESPLDSNIGSDTDNNIVLVANAFFKSEVQLENVVVTMIVRDNANVIVADPSEVLDRVRLQIGTANVEGTRVAGTSSYTFPVFRTLGGNTKMTVMVDVKKERTNVAGVLLAAAIPLTEYSIANVEINGGTSFLKAEYVSGNSAASEIAWVATSAKFTVKTPALNTITKADSYSPTGDEIVTGGEIFLGSYNISHNNVSEYIEVNNFDIELVSNTATTAQIDQLVNTITVRYGAKFKTENTDATAATANGASTDFSLGTNEKIRVNKNETVEVMIYANLAESFPTGVTLRATMKNIRSQSFIGGNSTNLTPVAAAPTLAVLNVIGGANFVVAKLSDNTPSAGTFVIGTDFMTIARYDIRVEKDNVIIQDMLFSVDPAAANLAATFQLFLDDGTTEKMIGGTAALRNIAGNYYIVFSDNTSANVILKNTDYDLVVKMKSNAVIDDATKTNKMVTVRPIDSIVGEAERTQIVSASNSKDVTGDDAANVDGTVVASTTTFLGRIAAQNGVATVLDSTDGISKTMYVRKTNLVVSSFTANPSFIEIKFATANGNSATVQKVEFDLPKAGIVTPTFNVDARVNWTLRTSSAVTYAVGTATLGSLLVDFGTEPVTISPSGTTIRIDITSTGITADSRLQVRLAEATPTDFGMTNVAGVAAASNVIRSDNATPSPLNTSVNRFTDAEITGLPTATLTVETTL